MKHLIEICRNRAATAPRFVSFALPNAPDKHFLSVAQDCIGTQICANGVFFPDRKDLGSLEAGLAFLEANEDAAIAHFKAHPKATPADSVDTLIQLAYAQLGPPKPYREYKKK